MDWLMRSDIVNPTEAWRRENRRSLTLQTQYSSEVETVSVCTGRPTGKLTDQVTDELGGINT